MAEPDFVLLYLGSLFEAVRDAPERDDPMLDALAGQILDELPKTLLGLIIKACAARWLRRNLWMVEFDSLSPSDQADRIVIDSAMRADLDAFLEDCDRALFKDQQPAGCRGRGTAHRASVR